MEGDMRFFIFLVVFPFLTCLSYASECIKPFQSPVKTTQNKNFKPIKNLDQAEFNKIEKQFQRFDLSKHLENYHVNSKEEGTGDTLLHKAVTQKNTNLIKKLIMNGASPYIVNRRFKKIEMLIMKRASPYTISKELKKIENLIKEESSSSFIKTAEFNRIEKQFQRVEDFAMKKAPPATTNKYLKELEELIMKSAEAPVVNQLLNRVISSKFFQAQLERIISLDPARIKVLVGHSDFLIPLYLTKTKGQRAYNVYLAGPEVFLPDSLHAGNFLKAQISLFNKHYLKDSPYLLKGIYPFDSEYEPKNMDFNDGFNIFEGNTKIMDKSSAVIANMVKFRGPGIDEGTAFEIGYMHAQNKIIVGYYDEKPFYINPQNNRDLIEKVKEEMGGVKESLDKHGALIEPFEMTDNLMVVAPVMGNKQWPISEDSWSALFTLKEKLDLALAEKEAEKESGTEK